MIAIHYSTTGRACIATNAPELPTLTPEQLQALYEAWSATDDKFSYVASLAGHEACLLVDYITAQAKAVRPVLQPYQEVLSYREAANYLGVSESAFTHLMNKHQIASQQRGRCKYVSVADIEALAQRRRAQ